MFVSRENDYYCLVYTFISVLIYIFDTISVYLSLTLELFLSEILFGACLVLGKMRWTSVSLSLFYIFDTRSVPLSLSNFFRVKFCLNLFVSLESEGKSVLLSLFIFPIRGLFLSLSHSNFFPECNFV